MFPLLIKAIVPAEELARVEGKTYDVTVQNMTESGTVFSFFNLSDGAHISFESKSDVRNELKKIIESFKKVEKVTVTQELPSQNTRLLSNTKNENTKSSLCTAPATVTDAGSDVFPIDPKYKGIKFLGQLFTAFNCGSERVGKIFGVDGNNYTLGSAIWLKNNPSQSLISTFKSIGFKCSEEVSDVSCKKWELLDSVRVDDIIKLEPYSENFEADDCRNCG